jgi:methanogenic corrinoid protein MtbC1
MTNTGLMAAQILESSAAGYASAANAILIRTPDASLPAGWGSAEWKTHLTQRILELATAVRVSEPDLFARRIKWLRRAVAARGASEADLRMAIESIRSALQEEFPENLISAVELPIQRALEAFDEEIEAESAALDASTEFGRAGLKYLNACLEAKSEQAIAHILELLDGGMGPAEIYTEILLPVQRETGELWHLGDISISEERLVTETTQSVMTLIRHRCAPEARADRTVVAASVAGNAHDIGLRALSDLFRLSGWNTVYLGANVPSHEIAYASKAFDTDLVALSATLTTQLRPLADVTSKIRQINKDCKILVGGLALEGTAELWQQLGADGYATDVRAAVTEGERLVAKD